uniref:Gag protein n=1 Tax=Knipowitschia caucasica TaxID=637954 RepID=A0AAV2IXX9_KNICA
MDDNVTVHELQSSPPRGLPVRLSGVLSDSTLSAQGAVSEALKIDLPPPFKGDGTESFSSWARRFEVAVEAMSSPDMDYSAMRSAILPTRLSDAAFLLWDSLPSATKKDYDTVKVKLGVVFGPKYDHNAIEGEKFRRFVAGLDPSLQAKIHEQGAEDIEEALRVASRCERARVALQLNSTDHACRVTSADQVAMVRPRPSEDKLLQAVEQLTLTVDGLRQEVHQLHEKHGLLAARFRQRGYYSPERYGRDTSRRSSPSPNAHQRYREQDTDWKGHYPSSPRSGTYARYERTDYPRSPSPAARGRRDPSPRSRQSVRFQSPERQAPLSQPGNFH